jgi:pimeloyl-ACP methyl ester carboxylesterase
VDLNTHITDITSLIEYEDLTDVVLVGHSYAGMVITWVAAKVPERLSQAVYLDAYLPDDGQSEADLWPADMPAEILGDITAGKGAVAEVIRDRENGLLVEPGRFDEIKAALISLIHDPSLRRRLAYNAQ